MLPEVESGDFEGPRRRTDEERTPEFKYFRGKLINSIIGLFEGLDNQTVNDGIAHTSDYGLIKLVNSSNACQLIGFFDQNRPEASSCSVVGGGSRENVLACYQQFEYNIDGQLLKCRGFAVHSDGVVYRLDNNQNEYKYVITEDQDDLTAAIEFINGQNTDKDR